MNRSKWTLFLSAVLVVGLWIPAQSQVITVDAADDISALSPVTYATPVLNLSTGFNLVSWGVDTPNDSIQVILAPIINKVVQVQGYERPSINPNSASGTGAKLWTPAGGSTFNTLKVTDHRLGYWIKMSAPDTLRVSGHVVPRSAPIPLGEGFNLVAYLPSFSDTYVEGGPILGLGRAGYVDTTSNAVSSLAGKVTQVQGYETATTWVNPTQKGAKIWTPSGGSFNTLRRMGPKLGYWVKVSTADTLVYPTTYGNSGTAMMKALASAWPEDEHVQPSNQWIGIYGSLQTTDGSPVAAGTVVEVVDNAGNVAGYSEVQNPGTYGYMPVYLDDPETAVDEGAEVGELLTVRVNGVVTDSKVRWTQFGDLAQLNLTEPVAPTQSGLPTAFALYPASPNPFNPETTISYDLPSELRVSLSIYSATGQLVRTLVSKVQSAGAYHVKWDGRDEAGTAAASGVYFSRLQAGVFEQTGSMLLLK
jgi:hypothetical protein